jgi:peptide/nickel transport system ATP-binding protein
LIQSGDGREIACHQGGIVAIVEAEGASKSCNSKNSLVRARHDRSFRARAGEVVAVIGQSGPGKTAAAEILSGVLAADSGTVFFNGLLVAGYSATSKKDGVQIVFQDPFSALNGRLTIEQIIREPPDVIRDGAPLKWKEAAMTALSEARLPSDEAFLTRRGHSLSGGRRQRLAVARALVMEPRLLIADEISSMLDPSTGANLWMRLKTPRNLKGFSMLLITHGMSLARKVPDWVYVMRDGEIVKHGPAGGIFERPSHECAKALVRKQPLPAAA